MANYGQIFNFWQILTVFGLEMTWFLELLWQDGSISYQMIGNP